MKKKIQGLGVLLASYAKGASSAELSALSDDDLVEECLQQVARIHRLDYRHVRREFVGAAVKHWIKDPWAMGAFVLAKPYEVIFNLSYHQSHSV